MSSKRQQEGTGAQATGTADGPVAVVGERDVVAGFQAAGLAVFPAEPGPAAAALVERLVRQGFRVVFFTDDLFDSLGPLLERYRGAAVPCLVALASGGAQPSVERFKEVVKRAVGADVFAQGAGARGAG